MIEQKGIVFWPRLGLFFPHVLFTPNKRGKKKRRINDQSRGRKTMPLCSISDYTLDRLSYFFPLKNVITYIWTYLSFVKIGCSNTAFYIYFNILCHIWLTYCSVLAKNYKITQFSSVKSKKIFNIFWWFYATKNAWLAFW